ncbi:hypothetical protein PPERSA_12146 [Pseudocohnilembus persalinus]|uniref:NAD(P)-binding domain n=1 Tax=Pseudocohnilembus persalinus TaxID=266149 RepID=A0A0V0QPK8_PSEPJ|nr:hypothetical protein PPERSA_12146 [Pseudocohnilembus persalinus]|eukprot:KRX03941.1 hypothetical protein PPERSA_12146 [Pseudocohnilembus persalinus]
MEFLSNIWENNFYISYMFQIIGWIFFIKGLIYVFKQLYDKYLRKGHNLAKRYGKGSYVLISEVGDEIGFQLISQLVKEGFNAVLISRNQQKLDKAEEMLLEINKTADIICLQTDFFESHKKRTFQEIEKELKILDISVLINNVTMVDYELFLDQPKDLIYDLAKVNQYAPLMLTQIVARKMVQRQSRSGIIYITSQAAQNNYPQAYASACQSFVVSFCRNISQELGGKIDFICCPNQLDSMSLDPKMNKIQSFDSKNNKSLKLYKLIANAKEFSQKILKDIGHKTVTYGTKRHYKIQIIMEMLNILNLRDKTLSGINLKMLSYIRHQRQHQKQSKTLNIQQLNSVNSDDNNTKINNNLAEQNNQEEDFALIQSEFVPFPEDDFEDIKEELKKELMKEPKKKKVTIQEEPQKKQNQGLIKDMKKGFLNKVD